MGASDGGEGIKKIQIMEKREVYKSKRGGDCEKKRGSKRGGEGRGKGAHVLRT